MTEQAAVRWLILGSGFVGSALAAYLESAGHVVGSLPAPRLEAGIDSDDAALANQAANHPALDGLKASMADVDCVVLAAGLATPDATATPALFGANALLPGVILRAAQSASVRRFIHLSSAAVQGRRRVLTEAADTHPFSAYSASKAMGERVIQRSTNDRTNAVMVRATSVQGSGRGTTVALRRIARSGLSSVARPGSQPSPLSSIRMLCNFVQILGQWPEPVPSLCFSRGKGRCCQQDRQGDDKHAHPAASKDGKVVT